ncbi:hypothetical protein [Actinomycetospora aeridis]|uniref:Uncharacterized protein n=1 Tax=Actinomycetospora aeridis TaxID=3129231 RepID=A0ABU8N146_9PSEU
MEYATYDEKAADAAVLRPTPEHHYPLPWRVAEGKPPRVMVVCAEGHCTCEAPTYAAANLIVRAVNVYGSALAEDFA